MDVLSKILDSLCFNGAFYFATDFHAPWGVEVPRYKNVARFHYIERGVCWLRLTEDSESVRLLAGDLVVIPHGVQHVLSDSENRVPVSLDQAMTENEYTGEGVFTIGQGSALHATKLVCGHFEFSESFQHPFLSQLPPTIIKQNSPDPRFTWLKETLGFLAYAATHQHDGSAAVIKRLSEVMFIEVVRHWRQQNKIESGFFAVMNDSGMARGLAAFHRDFASVWTVERLAFESNMSRSLFAEKFKNYMGESPMQYVSRWRLDNAKRLLQTTDLAVELIANRVGYESAAAFSKAFKRYCSQSPSQFRAQNELEA